jgi:hypothetical protein
MMMKIVGSPESISNQLTAIIIKDHFDDLPDWVNQNKFMTYIKESILGEIEDLCVGEHTVDFTPLMFPLTSGWFDPSANGAPHVDSADYVIVITK